MSDNKFLISLIETGYDIEFSYKGKSYSITKTGRNTISFCEFYKEPTEFACVDEFINNAKIGDELLKDIWDKVTDISVF